VNLFFLALEIFTVGYSDMPEHMHHLEFLYFGYGGNTTMVPWMWASTILSVVALVLLFFPNLRRKEGVLGLACAFVFLGIWIEKGLGMVIAGFIPTTLGDIPHYWPTATEFGISLGVYCTGALILAVLYKIAVTVRLKEPEAAWAEEERPAPIGAAGD
jgi:molybdopterin-containing oxidoreductase family membrane subunit